MATILSKLTILLMVWLLSWPTLACDRYYPIELIRVLDADTIEARLDLGFDITMTKSIRIAGFDAPETFRPKSEAERNHGLEATEFAKKLLVGKLRLISDGYGVYNRVEGFIILGDGSNFTQIMIDNGFEKRDDYDEIQVD